MGLRFCTQLVVCSLLTGCAHVRPEPPPEPGGLPDSLIGEADGRAVAVPAATQPVATQPVATQPSAAPPSRLEEAQQVIRVTLGQKDGWHFEYPNGKTSGELHLPSGDADRVGYELTSSDVIHAMFVPACRLKIDAIPKQFATGTFPATLQPGAYDLFCAEYCGARHSQCRAKVIVQEPDEFRRWLASR